ncbi:hypothetical protein [Absidia glauca]|uniref:Uncharacterized protein n=1 Tax=Absidia glauca TaxID=4829 RepID=A0A168L4U8_ABSGL|nr:hypothetical protein [Absidia glauca]
MFSLSRLFRINLTFDSVLLHDYDRSHYRDHHINEVFYGQTQHEVKGGYDKKRQNAADCKHVPPPPITMNLETKTKKPMTRSECILSSTGSLAADPQTQSDKIMLARLGRWAPLVYENGGQQLGLLTDEASASILVQKGETFGTWSSPINDTSTEKTVRGDEADYHIQQIKNTR